MKKYCLLDDIKKTKQELIRTIKWRLLGNDTNKGLAVILDTNITNLCGEMIAHYEIMSLEHQKGMLSNTKFSKCIREFKQLFKNWTYYKHYSQSLIEIKTQIEEKTILNEV